MLEKIKIKFLKEFWYFRAEALVNKLLILDDILNDEWIKTGYIYDKIQDMQMKVAIKLEDADDRFWYYAHLENKL